jgi:hypothetical protein
MKYDMKNDDELVKVLTDSEITLNLLKEELEEFGIPSLVKNDFDNGFSAGYVAGIPNVVDLYVNASDRIKAEAFIKEFLENNQ